MTWLVMLLPFVAWGGLVAARQDAALFMLLLVLELPFRLWDGLGAPVGRRADFYGWPLPNALGATLIVLTDLAAWYVVASAAAAAWRRVWRMPY